MTADLVWRSPLPDVDPSPALFHEEVLGGAARWPERVAVVDATGGRSLTYGQLVDGARRLAGGLRAHGARPGEVLALVAANGPDYPIVLYGALAAGLTVAPANPLLTARELSALLGRTGARYLVADAIGMPAASAAAAASGVETVLAMDPADGAMPLASLLASVGLPPEPGNPEAAALLFTSSGTSGLPKSVVHTHASAVALLRRLDVPFMRADRTDVFAGVVPFAHIYGTAILSHAIRFGAGVVSLPRFDLEAFLRMVQDHRVTMVTCAPPLVLALAGHPLVHRYDLSSLRRVLVSAARCPADASRECEARLGCSVGQGLGMTEVAPIALPLEPIVHDSVGRLVAGTEAVVVDPGSGARQPAGATGELWVRGAQRMRGYLGDERATAATIDAGDWLHTGDLCYFDADGNLFLVDRLKELIKHRGYQVAPAELEAELCSHPAVADAAVVPRPDREAGELPVAYVALRAPVLPDELTEWLAGRVAPHKRIWDVVVVERVPRSPVGKLLRRVLIERERARAGQLVG